MTYIVINLFFANWTFPTSTVLRAMSKYIEDVVRGRYYI